MSKIFVSSLVLVGSLFFAPAHTLAQNKPVSCVADDVQCMVDKQTSAQSLNLANPTQINEHGVDNAPTTCQDSNSACQNLNQSAKQLEQIKSTLKKLQPNRLNQPFQ